jgi:hypothetical protein
MHSADIVKIEFAQLVRYLEKNSTSTTPPNGQRFWGSNPIGRYTFNDTRLVPDGASSRSTRNQDQNQRIM